MYFVEARGLEVEIGQAQGESLREPICEIVDRLSVEIMQVQGIGIQDVLHRLAPYVAHMERELPHLAQEVHGISQGAKIAYLEAQLLNYQGEARLRQLDGCTSFAITSADQQHTIIGQNVDMPPLFAGMNRIMHVTPTEGLPFVMWGIVGTVGQRGVNADGLALVGNGLGGPPWKPGISSIVADRVVLESSTIDEAIARVRQLTRAKATNMLLADVSGRIIDVEWTPSEERILVADGAIAHSNCYVHHDFAITEAVPLPGLDDAPNRQKRADLLLDTVDRNADLLPSIVSLLSDHEDYPRSICRHNVERPYPYVTTASIIALLPDRVLMAADGGPCRSPYARFAV